ncbi:hypothetical protein [Solidesulfovibrio sp.]
MFKKIFKFLSGGSGQNHQGQNPAPQKAPESPEVIQQSPNLEKKQEWKTVKMFELYGDKPKSQIIRKFHTKVVGVKNQNDDGSERQDVIKSLKYGQKVRLIWNPHNRYDKNAIICAPGVNEHYSKQPEFDMSQQFGRIKSDLAEDIIGMANSKSTEVSVYAEVAKILTPHTEGSCYGVVLMLYIYDSSLSWDVDPKRKEKDENDIISIITKKYSPKKNIESEISLSIGHGLKIGDNIFINDHPIEYYSKFINKLDLYVDFSDMSGEDVARLQYHVAVKEKLLRAKFSGYSIEVTIKSIKDQDKYTTEILGHIGAVAEFRFIKPQSKP